jgi:hypothetical protein
VKEEGWAYWRRKNEELAATRERRRIARRIRPVLKWLAAIRNGATLHMSVLDHARGELEAATRSRGKGRK